MQTVKAAALEGLATMCSAPSTNDKPVSTVPGDAVTSSKARTPQPLLDKFWLKMAHMFGNTWTRQYGVDPAGSAAETWSAALAGLVPEQIAKGLQATLARGLEWPPSAPRFRAMCMGIPSIASVRHDMAHPGEVLSPFIRQFWSYLNTAEYNSGDEYRCERAVNEAYELVCQHVMCGKPLPPPVAAAIKHEKRPKPVPASDATVRMELGRIASLLGLHDVSGQGAIC